MIENPRPYTGRSQRRGECDFRRHRRGHALGGNCQRTLSREAVCMMAKIVVEAESNMLSSCRPAAAPAAGCRFRDDLRVDRARRRRPAHGGHRGVYRDRQHCPHGLEVPSEVARFTPSATAAGLQSNEPVLGCEPDTPFGIPDHGRNGGPPRNKSFCRLRPGSGPATWWE